MEMWCAGEYVRQRHVERFADELYGRGRWPGNRRRARRCSSSSTKGPGAGVYSGGGTYERPFCCCAAVGLADVERRLHIARTAVPERAALADLYRYGARRSAARRAMTGGGLRSSARLHIARVRSCWCSGTSTWMAEMHSNQRHMKGVNVGGWLEGVVVVES